MLIALHIVSKMKVVLKQYLIQSKFLFIMKGKYPIKYVEAGNHPWFLFNMVFFQSTGITLWEW